MASSSTSSRFPMQTYSPSSPSSRKREEDLVYLYEAEEERITNLLSRKLERLREEKIQLENTLEQESESHVNRLQRELAALRSVQAQQSANGGVVAGPSAHSATNGASSSAYNDPRFPAQDSMLEVLRRENEALRARLVDSERGYIRVSRMNEIYREELIELRRRLGLPIDNLIGLAASPTETYSQPTHIRTTSISASTAANSGPSVMNQTQQPQSTNRGALSGLPIPISRTPASQQHRQVNYASSSTTPLTSSPTSSSIPNSPFQFSPSTSSRTPYNNNSTATSSSTGSLLNGAMSLSLNNEPSSYLTQATTPPSSTSPLLHMQDATPFATTLSYPSVPPPSLSSSFGSPVYSRRSSFNQGAPGRRMSLERGSARIAETGTLRAAAATMALPEDVVEESPPGSPHDLSSSPSSVIGYPGAT